MQFYGFIVKLVSQIMRGLLKKREKCNTRDALDLFPYNRRDFIRFMKMNWFKKRVLHHAEQFILNLKLNVNTFECFLFAQEYA
jgi:hypothetical protein